ncbi:MAG: carboxypeptidase-like regulatory domain-containing protein, partial [Prolixibacteraceae bacterium]|nr:carboxypeptidase-like regulatory domain-containing protein [Prolixibacteraceae bacterium]
MSFRSKILLFFCLTICSLSGPAQTRIFIEGQVYDASTGEPLPYANIHFQKNKNGTISYTDGYFSINTNLVPDSMFISAIGFETQALFISKYENQVFNIGLKPKDFELSEILILPGENPATVIMKKVIDEKTRNNPLNNQNIACNAYTKILVSALNDLKGQQTSSGFPIYFSEKYSQNILQKNPAIE